MNTQTVEIGNGETKLLDFSNKKFGNLIIDKYDADTYEPLEKA